MGDGGLVEAGGSGRKLTGHYVLRGGGEEEMRRDERRGLIHF